MLFKASNTDELEAAFSAIAQQKIGALVVASDTVFLGQRAHVVALSARYKIAAVFDGREYTHAGGLISYGANRPAAFRPAGVCVGRILNGAAPADIPVEQPTTLELVVNLKTAKALGVGVPPTLLARADEVIEWMQCPLLAQSGQTSPNVQCFAPQLTSSLSSSICAIDFAIGHQQFRE